MKFVNPNMMEALHSKQGVKGLKLIITRITQADIKIS
jgi:hypothetical protein